MKKSVSVIIIFITLILVTNVLAYESTITVKTGHPDKLIIFKAADPDTGKTLPGGTFTETADDKGEVIFDYNLEPRRIKMGFMAQQNSGAYLSFLDGKETIFIPNVILDKFVDVDLNKLEPAWEAYSGEEDEEVNETETNEGIDVQVEVTESKETEAGEEFETETQEIEGEKEGGKITGAFIGARKAIFSKTTYYIVGGLLVLGVLFFIILMIKKKIKSKGTYIDFKIKDKEEEKEEDKGKLSERDKELKDAEKKIEEARAELDDIKNRKSKLQEAKENFEKARRELEGLE